MRCIWKYDIDYVTGHPGDRWPCAVFDFLFRRGQPRHGAGICFEEITLA
jgi:hypothetical protein